MAKFKFNLYYFVVIFLFLVIGFLVNLGLNRNFNVQNETVRNNIPGFTIDPSVSPRPSPTLRPSVTGSVSPKPSSSPKPTQGVIIQTVPFAAQAPFGEWSDPRQQDGCEEASALISISWARGETFSLEQAKQKILAISDFETEKYGGYHDTNVADSISRIYEDYFDFHNATARYNISMEDIINELKNGKLVVVPADGQVLDNPNFTDPGPERHMLVIIGYDPNTKEFITNDPGTRQGKGYRYDQYVLYSAIREYPTGYHQPIVGEKKSMIVVSKED